ncbi:hypothetical protein ETH_00041010 [Eimeria tenella]|uniref:Uncharacterized protein n=1 Tax=Eimeria tenella TaxID=5802 RepID=U6KPJ3_EIMTE|nr:hypothetical protein ETH_00041010 [Eimeria tenella]CDJ38833.1 hypothetical protein ETH_00041010 [Eimeria tenella]|eukprot:XP_013229589.1 hypothetical protein ETH_00041010 [Eimeria tenella]
MEALELELEQLKQQRSQLESIYKLKQQIAIGEAAAAAKAAAAVSLDRRCSRPLGVYRHIALLRSKFLESGSSSKAAAAAKLSSRISEILGGSRRVWPGAPWRRELELLLQQELLQAELGALSSKIQRKQFAAAAAAQGPLSRALEGLRGSSARALRWTASLLRF